MTHVLVTSIVNGELNQTHRIDCKDLSEAAGIVESMENTELARGHGYVGCIKVGDKIKRVF